MIAMRLDAKSIAGKSPEVERHAEIVVVGAGPAGVAAASAAAATGAKVLLIDENPVAGTMMGLDVPLHYGQRMGNAVHNKARMLEQLVATDADLAEAFERGVEVELGTYVWGGFVNGPSVRSLPGPVLGLADETRSFLVGFDRLVVASGARDLAIAFPGWEKPGVMGAVAAHSLLARYGAFAGRRMAVLGSGALGLATALLALDRGVEIAAVIEVADAPQGPGMLVEQLRRRDIPLLTGHAIKAATGGIDGVEAITVVGLDTGGAARPSSERAIACDTVCLAIGAVPNVELMAVLGCKLEASGERGGYVPVLDAELRSSVPSVFAAGDCTGVSDGSTLDPDFARAEGRIAGEAAAASLGNIVPSSSRPERSGEPESRGSGKGLGSRFRGNDDRGTGDEAPGRVRDAYLYQTAWLRALVDIGGMDVHACQCEEVSRRDIVDVQPPRYLNWGSSQMRARGLRGLVADGPLNQDQVKRLTRAGMGLCQGRRCREQVALLLAMAADRPVGEIPLASYRPPLRPLPLAVLRPTDEQAAMRENWEVWFGIASQWTPFWQIDAEGGGEMSGK
jgi:NADPH-dependent 2,4-dienoyl-CoA reductase/sulfur reductase-like enzyme